MRKLYTLFLLFQLFLFHQAGAQIATFSFAGSDGDEPSWNSTSTATGVQTCSMTRGSGVTAAQNADRFNSKSWTTETSPDMNDYIQFIVTPKPGYSVTLSLIALQHQRSGSGPKSFVVRTSLNNFVENATNEVVIPDVNTNQASTFGFPSPLTITAPLTIRIYAYNSEAENGTWGPGESNDGNDLSVSGSFMVLPVRFVNVRAAWKEKGAEISWTNATEKDILHYVIERSPNGQNFSEISKMAPAFNYGGSADYKATDAQPFLQANYYRIKAVETNGHIIYSQIIKIEAFQNKSSLSVYPNPVQAGSVAMLQMNGLPKGDYILSAYNSAAQLIYQQKVTVSTNSLTQTLALNNWKKGIYIIEMNGSVKMQQRMILQ